MPVYRGRTKGTWRVVISVHGRRREEIVAGSHAETKAREAALLLQAPRLSEARAGLTLSQWCLGPYLDAIRPRVRASTWTVRDVSVRRLMPCFPPQQKLATMSSAIVNAAIVTRLQAAKASTVAKELIALRQALRIAADMGHRVGQCKILPPKVEASRAEAYTDTELLRLFRAADARDKEFGRLVRWLMLTGVRRDEAIHARKSWIVGDVLRIPTRCPVTGWRPKGKRGRDVPLSREAMSLIRAPADVLWRWTWWPQEHAEAAWDEAGLEGLAHRLRHTFASKFLARNPDLWLLGQVMGHSTVTVTALYCHMLPGRLDGARGVVTLPRAVKTVAGTVADVAE